MFSFCTRKHLTAFAAAFAALLIGVAPLFAAGTPKIQFEEYEWSFGDMYQKEERSHTFTFKNVGDADLVVKGTHTSCGCTAAAASDKPVPPGSTGEIRVTYNSKSTLGDQSKTVTVTTNAPDSVTTLVVRAMVKTDVNVPNAIQFGNVSMTSGSEQVIDVVAEAGLPFQIAKVEADAPYLTASFKAEPPKAGAGNAYKVAVKLGPNVPVGNLSNRLRIFTNLEKKPVIEVPIFARVTGNLKLSAEAVNFGSYTPGAAKDVVITLEAPASHPISITAVRSSTPDVTATLKTLQSGLSYEVHCAVSAMKQTGRITGKLIIETNDAAEPKRELQIIGFPKS